MDSFSGATSGGHGGGGVLERFRTKKSTFKRELNSLVDDLFGFFFTEVSRAYLADPGSDLITGTSVDNSPSITIQRVQPPPPVVTSVPNGTHRSSSSGSSSEEATATTIAQNRNQQQQKKKNLVIKEEIVDQEEEVEDDDHQRRPREIPGPEESSSQQTHFRVRPNANNNSLQVSLIRAQPRSEIATAPSGSKKSSNSSSSSSASGRNQSKVKTWLV